jgi:hypothetical protein
LPELERALDQFVEMLKRLVGVGVDDVQRAAIREMPQHRLIPV